MRRLGGMRAPVEMVSGLNHPGRDERVGPSELGAHPSRARLGRRFRRALTYAAKLHASQVREVTGGPYVSHIISSRAASSASAGTTRTYSLS